RFGRTISETAKSVISLRYEAESSHCRHWSRLRRAAAGSRHREHRELAGDRLAALVAGGGTLADLKGIWPPDRSSARSRGRCEGVAMRHEEVRRTRASLLVRKRFQFAGALAVGALIPWAARLVL